MNQTLWGIPVTEKLAELLGGGKKEKEDQAYADKTAAKAKYAEEDLQKTQIPYVKSSLYLDTKKYPQQGNTYTVNQLSALRKAQRAAETKGIISPA